MINRIRLLRNVGKFDSVDTVANFQLARVTVIYAENGRGKTTFVAILRSLATGDPIPIAERHRLAAQHPPHVVLDCAGGPPEAIFQNGTWNRTVPDMVVFDDMFVDTNVYSGLAIGPDHRQKLHELILGAQGVALNQQLHQFVTQIEAHNTELRARAALIPANERGILSVDEFCALPARTDIDDDIQSAERALAAAQQQEAVRTTPAFDVLSLPLFDVIAIEQILHTALPQLDAAAAARVQAHLAEIGRNAEAWVADGMLRVPPTGADGSAGPCPFCAQDLQASPVINHYRAYFSEAYAALKRTVSETITTTNRTLGGEVPASFERAVRVTSERRQFWARFSEVPTFSIDTAVIARDWRAARDSVLAALSAKQAAPLERMTLGSEARAALAAYEAKRELVAAINRSLQHSNALIDVAKEQAAAGNVTLLASDLARLKAIRARHMPSTAARCDAYLAEKNAKANAERRRDEAKIALDQYRSAAFPGYQTAINQYLQQFVAGFRVDSVTSADTRGGPTCTYNVLINNTPVAVAGGVPTPGQPSFRNTLSAGDRNTLALAFFFASLDQDPALAAKIVVVDDPISSLDEHRSLTTVQELRRLAQRVSQVIVLSHNKKFLGRIWEGTDRSIRAALHITRDGLGSSILPWDVDQDSVTDQDRRHAALRAFLANQTANDLEIARSIRPLLEAFLRVAYPEHYPPGTLLGPFRDLCDRRENTQRPILSAADIQELRDLTEYANRFHHDTNPAWETETINDAELRGFVERALNFARRG